MKMDLESFLKISGYSFFHETGSFDEKLAKAIEAFELDETDRVDLISALLALIDSTRTDEELKTYWDGLNSGVGFDKPAMVRWWLKSLVETLREQRAGR